MHYTGEQFSQTDRRRVPFSFEKIWNASRNTGNDFSRELWHWKRKETWVESAALRHLKICRSIDPKRAGPSSGSHISQCSKLLGRYMYSRELRSPSTAWTRWSLTSGLAAPALSEAWLWLTWVSVCVFIQPMMTYISYSTMSVSADLRVLRSALYTTLKDLMDWYWRALSLSWWSRNTYSPKFSYDNLQQWVYIFRRVLSWCTRSWLQGFPRNQS